jgi:hypothetical protein
MDLGIRFTMTWDTHMEKLCESASQIFEVRGQSLKFWVVFKHCGYPIPILNRGLEVQIKNFNCWLLALKVHIHKNENINVGAISPWPYTLLRTMSNIFPLFC